MTNRRKFLEQFTSTYLDQVACNQTLEKKWPKLRSLLPANWWYPESPLRQWVTYNRLYESAITRMEEEFVTIHKHFPTSFQEWVGSIGVSGGFWSKRFESMVIFLLLRAGLNVESIEPAIPGSKNVLDIKVSDKDESVYIECTSLRGSGDEALVNVHLHGMDYLMHLFSQLPGSYYVSLKVIPNLEDKADVDRFFEVIRDFIVKNQPQEEVELSEIDGFTEPNRMTWEQMPAARIIPVPVGNRAISFGSAPAFVSMSANTLRNSLNRKMLQIKDYPGQKIIMVDGSFHSEAFISNVVGFKEDIRFVLKKDKLQSISFVTLSQMNIASPTRLITTYAFAAPWSKVPMTPLVNNIMAACGQDTMGLKLIDFEDE